MLDHAVRSLPILFFLFLSPASTMIYTLSLHDALPISSSHSSSGTVHDEWKGERGFIDKAMLIKYLTEDELNNSIFYVCGPPGMRSEEHTSELQSRSDLVCRLLLEKKNYSQSKHSTATM